jgi:hypothetical protein
MMRRSGFRESLQGAGAAGPDLIGMSFILRQAARTRSFRGLRRFIESAECRNSTSRIQCISKSVQFIEADEIGLR